MTAFMDTFAMFAWVNPRDQYYDRVTGYIDVYPGRFVTTEWVLVEFADGLADPKTRALAVRVIRKIRSGSVFDIVPYDAPVYQDGFDLFAARPDKEWSLTDYVSFTVMAGRGLTDALTADRHFTQAGFRAVFAD